MSFELHSTKAKHRKLQIEILQKIARGEWKVNELIPAGPELYKIFEGEYAYGIVRKTIELLIEEDCLISINGYGVYVSPNAEVIIQNLIEQVENKIRGDMTILTEFNVLKGEVIKIVDEVFDNKII